MAFLINRNPSGRLLCLHGLLQYVEHHWGEGPYEIKNFKFDATKSPNIHDFSPCATNEYGFQSCLYLDNPSSLAGCGLVNSVIEDTQKSKSASDIFNALDGLGFITRRGSTATITELGQRFIGCERSSPEWELIARTGAQNYGPFAGLIYLTSQMPIERKWFRKDISLGFSDSGEEVSFDGGLVTLSTGSQNDTITRSRSSIISWGVATGYYSPTKLRVEGSGLPAQVTHHDYLMAPKWTDGFWNSDLVYETTTSVVQRPLSYNQLVKSIKSLRENGQDAQRNASLRWETVIKNRRLAIAYALHRSAELNRPLIFDEFVSQVSLSEDFVVSAPDLTQTLAAELGNAFVIGTPYRLIQNNLLQGVRQVNLEVLTAGADQKVIEFLERLASKQALFGS
jgi:hypothetical protein